MLYAFFFFSSRRRHTRLQGDWSSDVCSSDLRQHLRPGGRLIITIFAFLGLKTAFAKLEAAGFTPTIVASEVQSFPRIGYERLEHIRAGGAQASVPAGMPVTVERVGIHGAAAE